MTTPEESSAAWVHRYCDDFERVLAADYDAINDPLSSRAVAIRIVLAGLDTFRESVTTVLERAQRGAR